MTEGTETKTVQAQCHDCRGTGLYTGIGERDGLAVVCGKCEGTGQKDISYTPFTGRKTRENVRKVIQVNPGIVISPELTQGGAGYQEWLDNPESARSPGREVREFYCPTWWYQRADSKLLPEWDECIKFGDITKCPSFQQMEKCWERFDRERFDREQAEKTPETQE